MIYGKYKYFSHKFNNLEERHAELVYNHHSLLI